MTVNQNPTGRALSVPAGLLWGVVTAAGVTLAGSLGTAKLLDTELIAWNQTGYAVLVILLASSWAGAVTAAGKIRRRRLMMCLLSGGCYWGTLLLMTALFFGGQYSGVGETALLIFCGSMLGAFTGYGGKNRRIRPKTRGRNR